jgi:hypothetical protein
MNGKEKLSIRMVSFSNPRDSATISFVSPKGEVKSVFIHRETFNKLMSGKLDKEPGMNPSLDQMELRESLTREVKGNYIKWFDTAANELLQKEANARTNHPEG